MSQTTLKTMKRIHRVKAAVGGACNAQLAIIYAFIHPCLAVMCVFVFIGYSTISLRRRLAAKVARLTLIRGHVPAAAEVEIRHRRRHLAETAARPRIPRGECHIFPDISPSCMSASISPELHVRSLPNFAHYLRPWLAPPLVTLRCVTYFRF